MMGLALFYGSGLDVFSHRLTTSHMALGYVVCVYRRLQASYYLAIATNWLLI